MAATTTTSAGFFNFRSGNVGPRVRASSSGHGGNSCGKLDGVAAWLVNGVAAAFFASLERCSCIRINTMEDVEEGNDVPLILNDGNYLRSAGGAASGRRRTAKGKNKGSRAMLMMED